MRKPIDYERVDRIKTHMADLKRSAGASPCILFTTFHMSHNYLKLLYYLKKVGAYVVVLVAEDKLNGALSLREFEGRPFFDCVYASNPYDLEMPLLISEHPFDLVHAVVGSGPPYPVSEMLKRKSSPVVVEYCDFREILFDGPEGYRQHFGVEDWDAEQRAWRTVFTRCDGIVYKDSPEIVEHLSTRHHHTPKSLQFMSYVSEEFAEGRIEGGAKRPHSKAALQAVFAGCVHNNPKSHAYSVHSTLLEVAEKLMSQGLRFTIVNALDVTGKGYEPYLQLAAKNGNFDYRFALPQHRLAELLSNYDMGVFFFDYSRAIESDFFYRTTFGSKIFNYMEAGLPVLVSAKTAYMADLVKEHGIGLVLDDFSQLDSLGKLISRIDWAGTSAKIKLFSHKFSMESQMPRLLQFYNTICGRELFDTRELLIGATS